jgi:hypothetical protein
MILVVDVGNVCFFLKYPYFVRFKYFNIALPNIEKESLLEFEKR